MKVTRAQVQLMAKVVGFEIPVEDLDNVALRLSTLLTAMEEIERELGAEMDKIDPIPPVCPHEEF